MKVDGTLMTLAGLTRAALKIWQVFANPLLCQGVDGDVAMAVNSRRPVKKVSKKDTHIAFDDKCKLISAALYVPPGPQSQVVALANWESAPTFVLDDHYIKDVPKASTDRLLNKCNPFLSGKHRAVSDDIISEALTVSTDCSTIPEEDELDDVEQEESVINEEKPITVSKRTKDAEADLSARLCEATVTGLVNQPTRVVEVEPKKQKTVTDCMGDVKCETEQKSKDCLSHKTETSCRVKWVQVGFGHYEKYYINGEKLEETEPIS